jgi:hypothetical protein
VKRKTQNALEQFLVSFCIWKYFTYVPSSCEQDICRICPLNSTPFHSSLTSKTILETHSMLLTRRMYKLLVWQSGSSTSVPSQVNRSFSRLCKQRQMLCLMPVSRWFLVWFILRFWRWRLHVSSKRRLTFNGVHGVISQKTEVFMTTAVRTSSPACKNFLAFVDSLLWCASVELK